MSWAVSPPGTRSGGPRDPGQPGHWAALDAQGRGRRGAADQQVHLHSLSLSIGNDSHRAHAICVADARSRPRIAVGVIRVSGYEGVCVTMHAACLIPFLCRSSFSRVSPATCQNALASSESMRASQAAHSPSRTTMRSARQLVRPDILATSLSGFGLSDTSTSRAVAQWFGLAPWTNSPSDLRRTPRRRQPHFSIQSRGVVSERASSLIADCGFIRQVPRTCYLFDEHT